LLRVDQLSSIEARFYAQTRSSGSGLLELIAQNLESTSDSGNCINDFRGGRPGELMKGTKIVERRIEKQWDRTFIMANVLSSLTSPTVFGGILILPDVAFDFETGFNTTVGGRRIEESMSAPIPRMSIPLFTPNMRYHDNHSLISMLQIYINST